MDSLKDILANLKKQQEEESGEQDSQQEKLFDTTKLKTNPRKLLSNKHKYISTEHQAYGLSLASKLGDKDRATMYIKWAKEKPRAILQTALSFASDYPHAKDKSRIFMWKVKQLEQEREEKKTKKQTS